MVCEKGRRCSFVIAVKSVGWGTRCHDQTRASILRALNRMFGYRKRGRHQAPRAQTRRANRRRRSQRRSSRQVRQKGGGVIGTIGPTAATAAAAAAPLAYVITIDENGQRIKHLKERAVAAGLPITVWRGVLGTQLNPDTLPALGIGKLLYKARGKEGEFRNLGSIGCFLSHRDLYDSILKERPENDEEEYLILEDDITFGPTFVADLKNRMASVPSDWDIVYLSKMKPYGDRVSNSVVKLKPHPYNTANHGTWAFLIKQRVLRDFMNPLLKRMTEEIDGQVQQEFNRINAYAFDPPFISIQSNGGTFITGMDSGARR